MSRGIGESKKKSPFPRFTGSPIHRFSDSWAPRFIKSPALRFTLFDSYFTEWPNLEWSTAPESVATVGSRGEESAAEEAGFAFVVTPEGYHELPDEQWPNNSMQTGVASIPNQ